MEELFLKILNMSITATYVMLAVLVLRLILKRAPKWISYALWSLVLFRLVCPVSISSAFSFFGRIGKTASTGGGMEHIPVDIGMMSVPQVDIGTASINTVINNALPAATPAASANPMQILVFIGACIWLAGIALMLTYSVVSYLRLKCRMMDATLVSGNIFETDKISSPFVCGFIKPKIYLPVGLSGNERDYVLRHEQTHISRRDYIIKPLAFLALSVHWFNPFMWLTFILMSRDLEMSCDEKVVSGLDSEGKAGYSSALIQLAMKRPVLAGSPLAFGESGAKGRIKNVLNYKKPAFWVIAVAVIACIAAAVLLSADPAKTLELPEAASVLSLDMEQFNEYESLGAVTVTESGDIETVLSALSGARKTLQYSVYDYPTQSNYLVIRLNLSGERRTLCLYSEGNVYYIEEPYVGIYRSTRDASVATYKIYTGSGGVYRESENDLSGVEIFVWKDNNQTMFSVFRGVNISRTEDEIYSGNMVFSDIADVNKVLETYKTDYMQISIRQMNIADFTKNEMEILTDGLRVPAGNYSIGIGLYVPAAITLDEVRQKASFNIFLPAELPADLVVENLTIDEEPPYFVRMDYSTKDGSVGLTVLNGPAGSGLAADPRKKGETINIRSDIEGHYLVNQPEFGGPILWWEEAGSYVALSGPGLSKDDLVKIAESIPAANAVPVDPNSSPKQ